jgi:hypothetical protein
MLAVLDFRNKMELQVFPQPEGFDVVFVRLARFSSMFLPGTSRVCSVFYR